MKQPNVLLVTIDSLRADWVSCLGGRGVTPNLDSVAEDGLLFEQAYATGPVTPHSFPGILTSTYPFDYHGPRRVCRPRVLLSEVFQRQGYLTAAFHSNPYLSEYFGYNAGWNVFENMTLAHDTREEREYEARVPGRASSVRRMVRRSLAAEALKTVPEIYFWSAYLKYRFSRGPKDVKVRASVVNEAVTAFMDSARTDGRPMFLWVHYMDVHTPYISAKRRFSSKALSYTEMAFIAYATVVAANRRVEGRPLRRFARRHVERARAFYGEEVAYVDYEFGRLIDWLKRLELYDQTVVIVTADHGDEFLEHWGGSHSAKLVNELLHVPLIVKPCGRADRGIRATKIVSLLDLPPTVCELAGVSPDGSFKGSSALGSGARMIFHETLSDARPEGSFHVFGVESLRQLKTGCQNGRWKYVADWGTGRRELYNTAEDPTEQREVGGANEPMRAAMEAAMAEFLGGNPPLALP